MGKDLGHKCPYPPDLSNPQTKCFFEKGLQDFMKNFPNLLGDAELMKKSCIDHGSHKISLSTHLKVNAKNGFKRGAKMYR